MVGCQRESWWEEQAFQLHACIIMQSKSRKKFYNLIYLFSDNFNVVSLDSKNNYYSNYSIQGKKYPRSYIYNVNVGSETYSFIAIDACLKPGPRRPFNFVGILDQQEIDKIQQLVNQSKESNADHAIVFGHYPTSCILSQSDTNIRNILGKDIYITNI